MNRIQNLLQNDSFKQYVQLNEQREKERPFCRHGLQHLLDVARILYILVLEAGVAGQFLPGATDLQAKEIIYAAGLLHDIGRWKQYDTGTDHAVAGAELAVEILAAAGFNKEEKKLITRAIACHRSTAVDGGLLGAYLRRADDLSRPCWLCRVRDECKKLSRMETAMGLQY